MGNTMKSFITGLSLVVLLSSPASAEDAVSYEEKILPIFEEKCMSCHRETYKNKAGRTKKPKGALRMDDATELMKGGDSGDSIVAGDAKKSLIYERVILDEDHDDIMPPKDGPLSKDEIELIKKWIDGGAKFGAWKSTAFDAEGKKVEKKKDGEDKKEGGDKKEEKKTE